LWRKRISTSLTSNEQTTTTLLGGVYAKEHHAARNNPNEPVVSEVLDVECCRPKNLENTLRFWLHLPQNPHRNRMNPEDLIGKTLVRQDGARRVIQSVGIRASAHSQGAGRILMADTVYLAANGDYEGGSEFLKKIEDEIALGRWRVE
jgi:hypothetical protein